MADAQVNVNPPVMKRSRAKLWIRTGILAVFGTLFGVTLVHDSLTGVFNPVWGLVIFVALLPVGFWMRRLVPMQTHPASGHVTMSFDKIYFAVILSLVLIKAVAGNLLHVTIVADIAMCAILGLMIGRLSGICLRVHDLRIALADLP